MHDLECGSVCVSKVSSPACIALLLCGGITTTSSWHTIYAAGLLIASPHNLSAALPPTGDTEDTQKEGRAQTLPARNKLLLPHRPITSTGSKFQAWPALGIYARARCSACPSWKYFCKATTHIIPRSRIGRRSWLQPTHAGAPDKSTQAGCCLVQSVV